MKLANHIKKKKLQAQTAGVWLGEMKFLNIKDKHLCEYSSTGGDLPGGKKIKNVNFF